MKGEATIDKTINSEGIFYEKIKVKSENIIYNIMYFVQYYFLCKKILISTSLKAIKERQKYHYFLMSYTLGVQRLKWKNTKGKCF